MNKNTYPLCGFEVLSCVSISLVTLCPLSLLLKIDHSLRAQVFQEVVCKTAFAILYLFFMHTSSCFNSLVDEMFARSFLKDVWEENPSSNFFKNC